MVLQALRVALQLAVFRGGPQDMPYSIPLLRAAVAMAVVSTALLLAPISPLPLALATGLGGAAGVAFFTRQVLRGRKLDNRVLQTVTAQLMVGSLFALVLLPAVMALAPAMLEMMELMRAAIAQAEAGGTAPVSPFGLGNSLKNPPPGWAALWSDLVFVWSLVASTRVYRLAADLNRLASWLLTLLSLFVLTGFVLLAQLLASLLFV